MAQSLKGLELDRRDRPGRSPSPSIRRSDGWARSASRSDGEGSSTARVAARRATAAAGVPVSGWPPELSTATFQRASSATTRCASARSGVTRAASRAGSSAASRRTTATASASSRSLAASITVRSTSASGNCGAAGCPQIRRGGGPHGVGDDGLAAMAGRRRHHLDRLAVDADVIDEPLQAILRMGVGGAFPRSADGAPGGLVEIGVEAGQDEGTPRVAGDHRQKIARGGNGARRTRGDQRARGSP